MSAQTRTRQLCAAILIALAISPITAPFCTCDLAELTGFGQEGASVKLKTSSSETAELAASTPSGAMCLPQVGLARNCLVTRSAATPAFLHAVLRL